jgi:transcriptional accessory protein Tex/SPT6
MSTDNSEIVQSAEQVVVPPVEVTTAVEAAVEAAPVDANVPTAIEAMAEPVAEVAVTPEVDASVAVAAEAAADGAAEVTDVAAEAEAAEVAEVAEADGSAEAPMSTAALADLKPKMQLMGKVKAVALFGAFLDLGVGMDALLHVSQFDFPQEFKNVSDVVNVGDELTVWVRKIDTENQRIDVTMRPMLALGWNEIREGMSVTGKVVKIERFGVFVEIGAERPGMIHVSELASGYVNAPEDVVKVGDDVTAKVIKVNRKKKQIDLSRKALEEPVSIPADDSDDEPAMTAMELALRNAMRGTEMGDSYAAQKNTKRDAKKQREEKHRKEQEELLSRTLKNRVK